MSLLSGSGLFPWICGEGLDLKSAGRGSIHFHIIVGNRIQPDTCCIFLALASSLNSKPAEIQQLDTADTRTPVAELAFAASSVIHTDPILSTRVAIELCKSNRKAAVQISSTETTSATRSESKKAVLSSDNEYLYAERNMHQNPATANSRSLSSHPRLRRLLGAMSVFTMLMTIPQVVTIWVGHNAGGVSILTWSTYFISAVLWLFFGIWKREKNIYLPCIGWLVLDSAVILGALIFR